MNNEPLFFKTLLLKGEAGGTIDRIVKTDTVGLTDIYTIYINDGSTQEIEVTNGSSIASIEYTSSSGNVDTYTVTLTDGSTTTFNVTNGEDYTVPTDGVIYFDGDTVPDGYEETSAPSGSGSYATIDDNNVSVATTYSSSKIAQLISGISGGVDFSTAEQNTGLKWINGKPIYQKTYHIIEQVETEGNDYDITNINAEFMVSCGGAIKYGLAGGNEWYTSPRVGGGGYYATLSATNEKISIIALAYKYTEAYVTIRYTKTTDTV